jgi:exopolysaccharide biosynthesis polyprenyl glycosylphosphotransferase
VTTVGKPVAVKTSVLPKEQRTPARVVLQRRAPKIIRRHFLRAVIRAVVLVAGDLATFAGLQLGVWALRDGEVLGSPLAELLRSVVSGGYLGGWHYGVALLVGLFVAGSYGRGDIRRDPRRIFTGVALATALALWHTLWLRGLPSVLVHYAFTVAVVGAAVLGTRFLIDRLVAKLNGWVRPAERVLFVGNPNDPEAARVCTRLLSREHMELVGWVGNGRLNGDGHVASVSGAILNGNGANGNGKTAAERAAVGTVDDFWRVLQNAPVDTVVLCGGFDDKLFDLIVEASAAAGCRLLAISRYEGVGKLRPSLVYHHQLPFIELTVPALRGQQMILKRIVDIVLSWLGLVVLAPVFAVIAAAIRLDSPGPVFFSQERVGLGGKVFKLQKFRTMRLGADAEKSTVAHLNCTGDPRLFKIPDDPRVTRLGAWLRRWSLDELPQLWNVLRGQMSLVGPRPFFESDLAGYLDHHFGRLGAKPGITGLWQVNGRSSVVDFEEVVKLDREYIDQWSLWLDLRILFMTVPAVVRRTGAY